MEGVDLEYEALLQTAPDPVFLVDESGTVRETNQRATELLGYDYDNLAGSDVMSLHPASQAEAYETLFERTIDEQTVRTETLPNGDQVYLLTASGSEIPVELHSQTVSVEDATWVYTIARDITERKRAIERLERQRDLLDTLNQMVRHDLRNNLQIVSTHAELLDPDSDDEEYVETIQKCTTNAVEFTSTAADLAEVIQDPDFDRQPVELGTVLTEQCREVEQLHPEADIACTNVPPDVTVRATEMLESVFRNLLQNAIQHNDAETPKVRLRVERRDDFVAVHVEDNGRGVPDEQKTEIFAKGESRLDSEGTGIGLYLVRTLVEGYGGDISVRDNDPEGSVFTIELPTMN